MIGVRMIEVMIGVGAKGQSDADEFRSWPRAEILE
jgi:hypothetical protein